MPSSNPKKRFLDIIQNMESIISYIGDRDYDNFVKDRRTVDAVERCLLRIAQAAIKLQPGAAELLPDQNWKAMRGLGTDSAMIMMGFPLKPSGKPSTTTCHPF